MSLLLSKGSFPKLIGRVPACNSAPLIPNGRATLRNKVYPLAEVTCNENFVWSTEGPSVVTCDRSLGWQVNGTCNQAVWSNKLAPVSSSSGALSHLKKVDIGEGTNSICLLQMLKTS